MKKFTLLLAALIVLSCCLLAACGDGDDAQTSSTATSSKAASSEASSAEESKAESSAAVSSEEASSGEETTSEPETSEPETSGEEPSNNEPVESTELTGDPTGTNLALGATVTGADVQTASPQYNANLTDGKASSSLSYDGEWFAYWYNLSATDMSITNTNDGVAQPVVDLGEVMEIKAARINAFLCNSSGIQSPTEFVFEFSVDGETWTNFGSKTYPILTEVDSTVGWVGFELNEAAEARYVRISMTTTGACWTFVNEIEVY